jgi:hypothetical protein
MVKPDDKSVADDSCFLRALTQDNWWVPMEDRIRVSSVAFFSYELEPGETSCYADTQQGREVFAQRFPDTPAARFTARAARAWGFSITRDPEGDSENSPEHFVLTYSKGMRRGPYQKDCKRLALESVFTTEETLAKEIRADQSGGRSESQEIDPDPR